MKRILFQGDSITDVDRNRQHPDATNGMGCGYPLLIKARLNCDHPGTYECLNLGTGGHTFHGRREFVCVQAMDQTAELLLRLVQAIAREPKNL